MGAVSSNSVRLWPFRSSWIMSCLPSVSGLSGLRLASPLSPSNRTPKPLAGAGSAASSVSVWMRPFLVSGVPSGARFGASLSPVSAKETVAGLARSEVRSSSRTNVNAPAASAAFWRAAASALSFRSIGAKWPARDAPFATSAVQVGDEHRQLSLPGEEVGRAVGDALAELGVVVRQENDRLAGEAGHDQHVLMVKEAEPRQPGRLAGVAVNGHRHPAPRARGRLFAGEERGRAEPDSAVGEERRAQGLVALRPIDHGATGEHRARLRVEHQTRHARAGQAPVRPGQPVVHQDDDPVAVEARAEAVRHPGHPVVADRHDARSHRSHLARCQRDRRRRLGRHRPDRTERQHETGESGPRPPREQRAPSVGPSPSPPITIRAGVPRSVRAAGSGHLRGMPATWTPQNVKHG